MGRPVRPPLLFALDQNFPEPILNALATSLPMAELVPVRKIRPELSQVDDWRLMLALHQDERRWDGLITNDDDLLWLPKEMTVLLQTKLTLVVVKGEGDNPVRATGLLLCHLKSICSQSVRDASQVWFLKTTSRSPEDALERIELIAQRRETNSKKLLSENQLPASELRPKRWR